MTPDWSAVRQQFPALASWTYLNTATYGQMPLCASAAVTSHFARRDELACADFLNWFDDIDHIRESVARLIHAGADDIGFVTNAATALAIVTNGIDLQPGDRVVTLENEFPNNLYIASLRERYHVRFAEVPWESFYDSIDANTRLVVMSSANYTNGFRPPVAQIARFLRDRNVVFYLDGTQSVGACSFDATEVMPDMLAVNAYKWMLSPNGAGFIYVHPRMRAKLPPNVVGWRSDHAWREVNSLHHGAPRFKSSAEKYEGGMPAFPSLYAMGAVVEMMLELGTDEIERRVLDLAVKARCVLESAGGTVLHSNTPILAARFEGRDAAALAQSLRERRILVSARHGNLRVSVHFYNNEEDLDRLGEALRAEA
jgi:selenocysteine lyase/cysteine desulfurase